MILSKQQVKDNEVDPKYDIRRSGEEGEAEDIAIPFTFITHFQ